MFPITKFDGFDLGMFDEDDHQQSDTYSISRISRWYGSVIERKNSRTSFVVRREVDFHTLRKGIYTRLDSINTVEEFVKRPPSLSETEYRNMFPSSERDATSRNMMGEVDREFAGNPQLLSAISEPAIVVTIDRYAYSAPPEVKLQAGIEFAVWHIRQPVGTNKANALVRSGAATFLDAYKYRSI